MLLLCFVFFSSLHVFLHISVFFWSLRLIPLSLLFYLSVLFFEICFIFVYANYFIQSYYTLIMIVNYITRISNLHVLSTINLIINDLRLTWNTAFSRITLYNFCTWALEVGNKTLQTCSSLKEKGPE